GEEVMAPLHGVADLADPGLLLAAARGVQPEPRRPGPRPARLVAVAAVPDGTGQAALVRDRGRLLGGGGLDHQRLQHLLRLDPVVGVGPGHDHAQGHGPGVTGEMQRRAAFRTVYRRRARFFTPFFDGFLEPSRRTWSQWMPLSCS